MSGETDADADAHADVAAGTDATESVQRPSFKGCVFCYAGELAYYGVRKLRQG